MIKIDLITGFLGSGKTTFIKKYARYLMKQGLNIGILENDLGPVNIDMMLLHDLEGDNCELEMVSGGCDKDCYRRRFRTKLIAMGMSGYDRVLIEPSGVFDVDDFFDALYEEPLDRWYQIGNVITIADAALAQNLSPQADYVLASEAASAGSVILSRCQEASEEEISNTIAHLNRALREIHCERTLKDEVITKNWEDFTDEDFEKIFSCGYTAATYEKMELDETSVFDSLYFMNQPVTEEKLCTEAERIFSDPECGSVWRIKGFVRKDKNQWGEINAARHKTTVNQMEVGQEVVIVIGENLNRSVIEKYLNITDK